MNTTKQPIMLPWIVFGMLFISQTCFANPIIISPTDALLQILGAVGVCLTVDGIILVLGYAIINSLHCIGSTQFIKYLIFVVIAGFLINAIVVILGNYYQIHSSQAMVSLSFLFLGASNLILSRGFFALPIPKATLIGALMGLFTNPYLFCLALDGQSF